MRKSAGHLSPSIRNSLADAIIDNSGVMLVLLDRKGRIVRFNHACEKISGYTADEVIGNPPWHTLLPPEYSANASQAAFNELVNDSRTLENHRTSYWLTRKGERRLIDWTNTLLFDTDGCTEYVVSVGVDVTEREHAEYKLRAYREDLENMVADRGAEIERVNRRNQMIVNTAMDGFFVADREGRIRDCNEIYCQMLGYSREELLSFRVPDIEAVEDKDEVAAHIEKVVRLGSDRFDTLHRHKDGRLIDVEVSVTMTTLESEPYFYAFVHDISQRKQDETELIRAKIDAEEANAAKSEFLSRMSHELRTPLNAILGFGQLLGSDKQHPLSDDQSSNIEEILNAGNHLLKLVNEILDLSRIESGQMTVNLEPVNLEKIIIDCTTQIQPLTDQRNIKLSIESIPECIISADPTRLKQVLLNLLSNAIKYNTENGQISIRLENLKNNKIRVNIQDSGPGIPKESLSRLFSPFERLESAYTATEGTGIGLALVKKLIEQMKGKIGVESEAGRGSTFWFELPISSSPQTNESKPAKDVYNLGRAPINDRRKVLYVEDNPSNLKLMKKIISSHENLELIDAGTAEDGIAMTQQQCPDIILLDINLPGMDGFEALQQLKNSSKTRDIPVIAITANAHPRDIERGKAAGFLDYLTKPININQLLSLLDNCLALEQQPGN